MKFRWQWQFEFQFLCQPNPITLNHEKLRLGHKGNHFLPETSFTWISFRTITTEALHLSHYATSMFFIENTSWRVRAYGIYARVVDRNQTSECSNRARFLIQKQVCRYHTKYFHVVSCLLYTYWDSHNFGGLFISVLSKMLKFATTHHQMTMKLKYQPISKNVF